MSHRIEQIESTLKRAVAQVLSHELSDPRIRGLVSVLYVKVSPDLHDAYVYVSVLPQAYEARTLYGLRAALMHIQGKVKKAVSMRTVPHLEFRLDDSVKRQAKLDAAIRKGQQAGPSKPLPEGESLTDSPPAEASGSSESAPVDPSASLSADASESDSPARGRSTDRPDQEPVP